MPITDFLRPGSTSRFNRDAQRILLFFVFATSMVLLFAFSTPCVNAQTGQVNPPATSVQNQLPQPNDGRVNPAPWRPKFGPVNRPSVRVTPVGTSPVRGRQPTQQPVTPRGSTTGGLPLPNSPRTEPSYPIAVPSDTGNFTGPATGNRSPLPTRPQENTPATSSPASASPNPTTNSDALSGQGTGFVDPQSVVGGQTGRRSITRVTKSMDRLPNDAGQVWREYDITPYTSQIADVPDPQQAILDWILKETGTEMWFNQPLGILNADRDQLRVYHTPEIQRVVHQIVDRFVNTKGQVQNVEVSLVTVGKPNWRTNAYQVLQPIDVQSPGVEAWMITKENAALLRATLARRSDFKDHGTGRIGHSDGQTVVLRNTKPVQFIRNFRWEASQIPPYQPLVTTIDEGYTLEISSLSSLNGNTIEASISCSVDQVERLNTVKVEVPGAIGATTDRISLQIPQLVSWRLEERFRWPNDQVLLLSCGVVASPAPQNRLPVNLPGVLGLNRQRADALLFVDYRGPELDGRRPGQSVRSQTVPVASRR